MIQVAIIDDEPVIRRGIRSMINWAILGCEVCGDAADGIEGKTLIEKYRPNIIITDIRMPGMDGLDMIRRVSEIVPGCKIIILTGYRNFEYAQEAVRLGAFDLLTKPTKIEELSQIIHKAVAAIESERQQEGEYIELRQSKQRYESIVRERMLYHMIVGTDSAETGNAEVRQELLDGLQHYAIGLFEMGKDTASRSQACFPRMLEIIRSEFENGSSALCIGLGTQSVACVIELEENSSGWKERITENYRRARRRLSDECGAAMAAAFSGEGWGADSLPARLQECKTALECTFVPGQEDCVFYNECQTSHARGDHAGLREQQNRMLTYIRSGNAEAAIAIEREMTSEICGAARPDRNFIDNFYFDTILRIHSLRREQLQRPEDAFRALRGMIGRCSDLNDLNQLIEQIIRRETEYALHPANAPGLLLRKAMEYIDNHYSEDISLADVAAFIYASPCYTSHLFKKELNVNFVDYLNALRMNQAKKMLADSRYKIYEVAEAVGIPNEHYFSKLFKRYFGITASEYRQDAG